MVDAVRRRRTRIRVSKTPVVPAGEVFGDLYRRNVWGGHTGELYSGGGSDRRFRDPYRALILEFIEPGDRVVDLGCGDFRVGRELISAAFTYIGVDVVPGLIAHNHQAFGADTVGFLCLDVVEDELPAGQICLVRQVLQHLANDQIQAVLRKLNAYRDVFVTEQQPVDPDVPANLDKRQGGDTRIPHSAVYLDRPPFSIDGLELVLSLPYDEWTELRTFRIRPIVGGP